MAHRINLQDPQHKRFGARFWVLLGLMGPFYIP